MENKQKIESLEALKVSPGWSLIKKFLQENIDMLGEELLNDIDHKIEPGDKDRMYLKRHFQKRLLELPDNLVRQLQMESEVTEEIKLDPFE